MKVVFRCDAGFEHGLAAASRCLALAGAFADAGASPVFAVYGEDLTSIRNAGYPIIRLRAPGGPDHHRELLEAAADADLLVSDSPHVGTLAQARLREDLGQAKLVVIDEHADRYIAAAAVVNPSVSAYLCRYEHSMECKTILGASYALIRPDVASRAGAKDDPPDTERIVICMGAYDKFGQTLRLMDILDAFPEDFSVTAVMGRFAPNLEAVQARARAMKHKTDVVADPAEVGPLFAGATAAICAGGTTALELACLGVPAGYLAADDPEGRGDEDARALERSGLGIYLGKAGDVPDELLATKLRILLRHQQGRNVMSGNATALIDGKGAQRVVAKLSKYGIISI